MLSVQLVTGTKDRDLSINRPVTNLSLAPRTGLIDQSLLLQLEKDTKDMKLPLALLIFCFSSSAEARGLSGSHVHMHHLRPSSCYSCGHRSLEAKHEFKHSNPCPSTGKRSGACPGYVIDHVQALKHGGETRRRR